MKTKFSVNINKIALLRNARGGNVPNLLKFAQDCAAYGVDGITVHPRQDQRHITNQDVVDLAKIFPTKTCEFNIEGFPTKSFIEMVLKAKPTQVTLVPDASNQLTSDHGWDVHQNFSLLEKTLAQFKNAGIRTAIFIDPAHKQLEAAKEVGTDRVELYTGPYALDFENGNTEKAIESYKNVYKLMKDLELGINAGHDLNLDNLKLFKENLPELLEVSIGQAFVRDCLYFGLENAINLYKRILV